MPTPCGPIRLDSREPQGRDAVREPELPACVRDVLDAARRSRPEHDVTCLAFRTLEGGREIVRMGPDAELVSHPTAGSTAPGPRARDVLVLSVTVTETTFETVRSVTHVLVARTRPACGA
jgi:hypothetical protein